MFLDQIINNFGLIGIFITLVLETGAFLFFLPGDTLIFAAGIFVESGHLELVSTFLTIVVASTTGGHLGYFLGEKFGIKRLENNKFYKIEDEHIQKSKDFFHKYGVAAIIFSRFVPIIRTFISPTLGIIHYNKIKFAIFNFIASILWAASLLFFGMTIGKFFPNIVRYAEYIVLFALFIFLIPFLVKVILQKFEK